DGPRALESGDEEGAAGGAVHADPEEVPRRVEDRPRPLVRRGTEEAVIFRIAGEVRASSPATDMRANPWSLLRLISRRQPSADADPLPDAELLRRFAASRDPAAFELLVWRHGAMVLGTCKR